MTFDQANAGDAPLISILSAVFNEQRFIDEMIESVRRQDYENWELVFVDDGSTDSTVEKILANSAVDPRIRLASSGIKLGKVKAFNVAYEESVGSLITLLGGDDRLTSGSLSLRVEAHRRYSTERRVASFYKLRTLSEDRRMDGIELPKGQHTSKSGACTVLSRSLADIVFPIDESLVAEDLWLGYAAEGLCEDRVDLPVVVMEYRIHENNSNPRRRPFPEMSDAMSRRHAAYAALIRQDRFDLPPRTRQVLFELSELERLRVAGRAFSIMLKPGVPWLDRAAMASMSHPLLYSLRNLFYGALSGRRRR